MPLSQGQGALLGASICIVANTLISLALNVQKLAHVRMQGKMLGAAEGQGEGEEEDEGEGQGEDESGNEHGDAGQQEGGAQPNTRFLKSKLWWSGIGLMLLGETGNFICEQRPSALLQNERVSDHLHPPSLPPQHTASPPPPSSLH